MISLFNKHKPEPPAVVTLPTYAVTQGESDDLVSKREARLQWMRDRGLTYLGDPLQQAELRTRRRPAKLRLVETGRIEPSDAQKSASDER